VRVRPREIALVHSDAGGVGLNALALVDACSATAVATVGSEAKRGLLVERPPLAPERVTVRDRHRLAAQLDEALRWMKTGDSVGKIVLEAA